MSELTNSNKALERLNEIISEQQKARDEAEQLRRNSSLLHRLSTLKSDLASAFRSFLQ